MTKEKYTHCLACKKKQPEHDAISLVSGEFIHKICYEKISSKIKNLKNEIKAIEVEIINLQDNIDSSESFWGELKAFFSSSPKFDIQEAKSQIYEYKKQVYILSQSIKKRESFFRAIYAYWPTYPPDWDERRKNLFSSRGEYCEKCHSNYDLHIHHRIPLSRGGNHKLDNLTILCEDCHSQEHGGRKFTYDGSNKESAFSRHLAEIKYAINNEGDITFLYRKPQQRKYHRRNIRPYAIITVPHVHDNGDTICVKGYCYKRNAKRTFAIKRMKSLT